MINSLYVYDSGFEFKHKYLMIVLNKVYWITRYPHVLDFNVPHIKNENYYKI